MKNRRPPLTVYLDSSDFSNPLTPARQTADMIRIGEYPWTAEERRTGRVARLTLTDPMALEINDLAERARVVEERRQSRPVGSPRLTDRCLLCVALGLERRQPALGLHVRRAGVNIDHAHSRFEGLSRRKLAALMGDIHRSRSAIPHSGRDTGLSLASGKP